MIIEITNNLGKDSYDYHLTQHGGLIVGSICYVFNLTIERYKYFKESGDKKPYWYIQ